MILAVLIRRALPLLALLAMSEVPTPVNHPVGTNVTGTLVDIDIAFGDIQMDELKDQCDLYTSSANDTKARFEERADRSGYIPMGIYEIGDTFFKLCMKYHNYKCESWTKLLLCELLEGICLYLVSRALNFGDIAFKVLLAFIVWVEGEWKPETTNTPLLLETEVVRLEYVVTTHYPDEYYFEKTVWLRVVPLRMHLARAIEYERFYTFYTPLVLETQAVRLEYVVIDYYINGYHLSRTIYLRVLPHRMCLTRAIEYEVATNVDREEHSSRFSNERTGPLNEEQEATNDNLFFDHSLRELAEENGPKDLNTKTSNDTQTEVSVKTEILNDEMKLQPDSSRRKKKPSGCRKRKRRQRAKTLVGKNENERVAQITKTTIDTPSKATSLNSEKNKTPIEIIGETPPDGLISSNDISRLTGFTGKGLSRAAKAIREAKLHCGDETPIYRPKTELYFAKSSLRFGMLLNEASSMEKNDSEMPRAARKIKAARSYASDNKSTESTDVTSDENNNNNQTRSQNLIARTTSSTNSPTNSISAQDPAIVSLTPKLELADTAIIAFSSNLAEAPKAKDSATFQHTCPVKTLFADDPAIVSLEPALADPAILCIQKAPTIWCNL